MGLFTCHPSLPKSMASLQEPPPERGGPSIHSVLGPAWFSRTRTRGIF